MDLELQGKAALITGGSRGIGKAAARQLAREGVSVAICSRNEEQAKAAAEELTAETEGRVIGFRADTADYDDIKALVAKTVETFGRLDILVNNAARVGGGPVPDSLLGGTDDLMMEDFQVKMLGYVRVARECAPHMERGGWGRIINISGMAARASAGVSTGMRNSAVVNLSKVLADELGPKGVTVNCLMPGAVLTEMFAERTEANASRRGTSAAEMEQAMAASNAIRRIVTAEEIADVITFLCSPKALSITGEALSVSGGGSRAVFY